MKCVRNGDRERERWRDGEEGDGGRWSNGKMKKNKKKKKKRKVVAQIIQEVLTKAKLLV